MTDRHTHRRTQPIIVKDMCLVFFLYHVTNEFFKTTIKINECHLDVSLGGRELTWTLLGLSFFWKGYWDFDLGLTIPAKWVLVALKQSFFKWNSKEIIYFLLASIHIFIHCLIRFHSSWDLCHSVGAAVLLRRAHTVTMVKHVPRVPGLFDFQ